MLRRRHRRRKSRNRSQNYLHHHSGSRPHRSRGQSPDRHRTNQIFRSGDRAYTSRRQGSVANDAGPGDHWGYGCLVFSRFQLGHKLGEGSFGKVYKVTDIETGIAYAAKVAESSGGISMLENEEHVYSDLARLNHRSNIPNYRYYGDWGGKRVLIIDLLGSSLEDRLRDYRTYSIRDVLIAGIKINRSLKTIHDAGWLHRDVKPGNILYGAENQDELFLVDYGLAKTYEMARYDRGNTRISSLNRIAGDVLYASPNCHDRIEASFRDDFFSLGYSMVEMYKGRLPWEGHLCSKFRRMASRIKRSKEKTSIRSLCKGMSREMETFFYYLDSLSFSSRVNHDYVERLFSGALYRKYGMTI